MTKKITFLQIIDKYKKLNYDLLIVKNILFSISKIVKNDNEFATARNEPIDFNEKKLKTNLDKYFIKNQPLGHITRDCEFYGIKIHILKNIFVPRNETEELVEIVDRIIKNKNVKDLVDVCSGTGCIGLSLKHHNPSLNVTCTDINPIACENIKYNAKLNKLKVNIVKIDLLLGIKKKYDVLVSNPPYVNFRVLDKEMIKYENVISFSNSKNDIHFYEQMINNYKKYMKQKFLMAFEIGYDQKERINSILINNKLTKISTFLKDMSGKDRFLIINNL